MTKLLFLLRAPAARPLAELRSWVQGDLAACLLAASPARLKVTLSTEEPPRLALIPYRRQRIVMLSVWDPAPAAAAAARWRALLPLGGWTGYVVDESTPRRYDRDWPDGVLTPGVGLLTLFRRRAGLSTAELLRRWHGGHSRLALEVHPLWCYVRNVVATAAIPGSPPLDGIVEEHLRDRRELLLASAYFGGWARMLPNMLRVLLDVRGFIDLRTIENYLVTELWLRDRT
jgi:hypothetical protein